MIIVTVKLRTKPEYTHEYLTEFNLVAVEVRAEMGCLEYELYRYSSNGFEFLLFERWDSKEKLDDHLKTYHMEKFVYKTKDWFESKDIKVYEVQ